MRYQIVIANRTYDLEIARSTDNNDAKPVASENVTWQVKIDGRVIMVDTTRISPATLSLLIDGHSYLARLEAAGEILRVHVQGGTYEALVQDLRSLRQRWRAASSEDGPQKLAASMPGKVVRILAREGDSVPAGGGVIVVEAMKMQNEIRSVKGGTIRKLLTREGANVNAGEVLAIVE